MDGCASRDTFNQIRMNILHVNFDDTGGAAIASKDLHEALIKEGIDINYLTLNLTEQYSKERKLFFS